MIEGIAEFWRLFYGWASSLPVFMQVVVGIVIFFIGLYTFYFLASGVFTAYVFKTADSKSTLKHSPFFWLRLILSFFSTLFLIFIAGYFIIAFVFSFF